jgi:hypothetical protein
MAGGSPDGGCTVGLLCALLIVLAGAAIVDGADEGATIQGLDDQEASRLLQTPTGSSHGDGGQETSHHDEEIPPEENGMLGEADDDRLSKQLLSPHGVVLTSSGDKTAPVNVRRNNIARSPKSKKLLAESASDSEADVTQMGWIKETDDYTSPPEMNCKYGGYWYRPFGDVANSEAGVHHCRQLCLDAGYKYFSLQCPRALYVHCQCAKTLDGSHDADPQLCKQKNWRDEDWYDQDPESPRFGQQLGCMAWWAGRCELCHGPYVQGIYSMGSFETASVYYTSKIQAGTNYRPPTWGQCKSGGTWDRFTTEHTFEDAIVFANVTGINDCAASCRENNFPYFGTECPGQLTASSGTVYDGYMYCQCSRDLADSQAKSRWDCDRSQHMHTGHHISSVTNCYGSPMGNWKAGTYPMGGDGRGSVLETMLYYESPPDISCKGSLGMLDTSNEGSGWSAANWKRNTDVGTVGKSSSNYAGNSLTNQHGDVTADIVGVYKCAQFCKVNNPNFKYFGLQCPGSHNGAQGYVHCQCAEDVSSDGPVSPTFCSQNAHWSGGTTPCTGPFTARGSGVDYMLGGHGTGSVYHIYPPSTDADLEGVVNMYSYFGDEEGAGGPLPGTGWIFNRGFPLGSSGCKGTMECQFKAREDAEFFCSARSICLGVNEHADDAHNDCNEFGCFSPVRGELIDTHFGDIAAYHKMANDVFMVSFDDAGWPTGWSNERSRLTGDGFVHGPWGRECTSVVKLYQMMTHTKVMLRGRYWTIDSWDGSEWGRVYIGFQMVWEKHRTWNDGCAEAGSHVFDGDFPNPWASDGQWGGHHLKCYHEFDVTVPHTHEDLLIRVEATIRQGPWDESWAFNQLQVWTDGEPVPRTIQRTNRQESLYGWSDDTTTEINEGTVHGRFGQAQPINRQFELGNHNFVRIRTRFWAIGAWEESDYGYIKVTLTSPSSATGAVIIALVCTF